MTTAVQTQPLVVPPVVVLQRIFAMAAAPGTGTEAEWIHLCTTAADEAFLEVMSHPPRMVVKPVSEIEQMLDDYREQDRIERGEPPRRKRRAPQRISGEELLFAARAAASEAFLNNMPPLAGRRNIRAYIACAAVALKRGYVDARRGSQLLYAAQVAMSANPKRRATSGGK